MTLLLRKFYNFTLFYREMKERFIKRKSEVCGSHLNLTSSKLIH